MTDHADGEHDTIEHDLERETSPMQGYSARQVGAGLAVLAVGLLVAYLLPLLLG
jgi:hypothetical protein